MKAAVHARKSTDQSDVSDDQKSVARQIDSARTYAQAKRWDVVDEHVYVDDGISVQNLRTDPATCGCWTR